MTVPAKARPRTLTTESSILSVLSRNISLRSVLIFNIIFKWLYRCLNLTVHVRSEARLEFSMAMMIQVFVFLVTTTCNNVIGYQRFGSPCCIHLYPSLQDVITLKDHDIHIRFPNKNLSSSRFPQPYHTCAACTIRTVGLTIINKSKT